MKICPPPLRKILAWPPTALCAEAFLTVAYDTANDPGDFPNMAAGNYIGLSQIPYGDLFGVPDGTQTFNLVDTMYSVFRWQS